MGGTSSAAAVKPASGGGVTISHNGDTVITSGKYAGMTEYQRQQAVAAEIAARGVQRYGAQGYSDKVAANAVRAVDTGFIDPAKPSDAATIANAFNRAGISQDMAVASLQKAVATAAPAAPLTTQPPAPEIPFVDPIPQINLPLGTGDKTPAGGNVTGDGSTQDLTWSSPDPAQPKTKPAPGTAVVGGGLVYVLGIVLVVGVIVALVKKLRKSKR